MRSWPRRGGFAKLAGWVGDAVLSDLRQLAYPHTPKEVRLCLEAAESTAVAVERDGKAKIVIMPIEQYQRLTRSYVQTEDSR